MYRFTDDGVAHVRFDEREVETVNRAAKKIRSCPAQLIRAGAYEKAVNILNASGEAVYSVRELTSEVLRQLFRPAAVEADEFGIKKEFPLLLEDLYDGRVQLTHLSDATFRQFVVALRSLGAEMAPLIEDEYKRMQSSIVPSLNKLIEPWARFIQTSEQPAPRS